MPDGTALTDPFTMRAVTPTLREWIDARNVHGSVTCNDWCRWWREAPGLFRDVARGKMKICYPTVYCAWWSYEHVVVKMKMCYPTVCTPLCMAFSPLTHIQVCN